MSVTRYKNWLWGGAIAVASLLPLGHSTAHAADASRVPVKTLTYRSDVDRTPTEEVRWGRTYYGGAYYGPRGYSYAPRYYSGYRGGYYPPYGRYYADRYYPYYPGGYYVTPGYYSGRYYGPRYYGGGIRVGGLGIFWR